MGARIVKFSQFGFKRFRNRLLFYFIGLFAFTLTGVFVVVEQVFKQTTEANIRSELIVTERVFSQLLKERSTQLTQWAITLASDFAFKKVIMTNDHATILSALFNLSKRIGADAALLVSTDYRLVADVAHPDAISQLFFAVPMIKQAEENGTASKIVLIDQQPYQLVAVPVLAPDPVAWLCIGFKIDQPLLMQLKQLTQMEISILSQTPTRSILHASTLISKPEPELSGIWQNSAGEESFFWFYNNKPYLSRLIVLDKQADFNIAAFIQRSWDDALAKFYRLRWFLLGIALSSMAIILLVGNRVARTVSRPMQVLVKGVRAIGQGDYKYKVNLTARDETGELGRAFNEMSGQLAEKEKMRNLLGKVVFACSRQGIDEPRDNIGGETREITAMFSDLAGFTTIAENLQPQALVTLLNDYLTQMGKQIIANNGVIDKFIGDAIVAFWGAPVIEQNHGGAGTKKCVGNAAGISRIENPLAKTRPAGFIDAYWREHWHGGSRQHGFD